MFNRQDLIATGRRFAGCYAVTLLVGLLRSPRAAMDVKVLAFNGLTAMILLVVLELADMLDRER